VRAVNFRLADEGGPIAWLLALLPSKTEAMKQNLKLRVGAEPIVSRVDAQEDHLAQAVVRSPLQQVEGLVFVSRG
jgi:hypothetical protein